MVVAIEDIAGRAALTSKALSSRERQAGSDRNRDRIAPLRPSPLGHSVLIVVVHISILRPPAPILNTDHH